MKSFAVHHLREIVFLFLLLQVLATSLLLFILKKGGVATYCNLKTAPILFHGLRLRNMKWPDFFTVTIFIPCLFIYSWLLVYHADLSWPDHSHITKRIVSGELWMQINPSNGRFSPMLHQEFLIFSLFAKQAIHYYIISICYLALITIAMLCTIPFNSLFSRIILISTLLFSTSFALPISGLIFPEINIILGFTLFLYIEIKRIDNKNEDKRNINLINITSLAVVTYLIYLKEPFFLFFICYSVISVCSFFMNGNTILSFGRSQLIRNFLVTCSMELCYVIIAIIYLILYYILIYCHITIPYASESNEGLIKTIIKMVYASPLLALFIFGLIIRGASLIGNPRSILPVWDPFAFSLVIYMAVLIYHGLWFYNYYLPVIFFSILYIPRTIVLDYNKYSKAIYLAISFLILVCSIPKTLLFFQKRELFMESRNKTVNKLLQSNNDKIGKIYFIERIKGYEAEEFVSYAKFKGLEIYLEDKKSQRKELSNNYLYLIPLSFDSNKNVTVKEICDSALQEGYKIQANDLIVSLPDQEGKSVIVTGSNNETRNWTKYNMEIPYQDNLLVASLKRLIYSQVFSNSTARFEPFLFRVN